MCLPLSIQIHVLIHASKNNHLTIKSNSKKDRGKMISQIEMHMDGWTDRWVDGWKERWWMMGG